jgi:hypothetical protein
MITLFRRGRTWWACATFDGSRRRWSLRTRDREVAKRLGQQAELEILSGGRLKEESCERPSTPE